MFSKTAKYGLRAVTFIAEQRLKGAERVRIDDVAAKLDIPRNYLSKVLHSLGRGGILDSVRGPGGGFGLARDPDDITLGHVIGVLDDWKEGETPCLLWDGPCTPDTPCVAHHGWKDIAEGARGFLRETSVLDLLDGADHPALRF